MIHLYIIDPSLEVPLPSDIYGEIASQADYVGGYAQIARAIHEDVNLNLLVSDKIVGRWLKVMAKKYGPESITIEELTPRHVLQEQTGITLLPIDVTDERILSSGLLELKIPASSGILFEDYLLEVFFGSFLTLPNGLRRVSDIISAYEPEQWQEALSRPLVHDIYQEYLRVTRQELKSEGRAAEVVLLDWISDSPSVYIRNLFALKVLSNYPEEIGLRVFGDEFISLLRLNLDLRRVPFVISGNDKTLDEVKLFLERALKELDETTLESLLDTVSGSLDIEFDAIQRLVSKGKQEITPELIRRIQARFQPLQSSPRIGQALADLDLLIKRNPPDSPDPSWDAEAWIDWAERQYLPYRYWLENTGRLDDEIGETANAYAEWLYASYGTLLYHSDRMVWKALLNLKEDIKTHAGPVLVVVVDNFNSKFYEDLQSHMQRQGFYEHRKHLCFSLLPSCTEVSKKCLMTGHYATFEETGYQNQVEVVWTERLEKRIKYLATISDLRAVNERQHDVYFLNYLPLDITLHLNEDKTGISHTQAIRTYLNILTQDISSFAQRIGGERDLMVIFVSDHGSTRIPRGTVNVIKGNFYSDRAEDEHHRYIKISDEELKKLPGNSAFDCYFFEKDLYGLSSNYLVARKLYRFRPTDDHAYVHGGLTPEETLVPLAIYQPVTIRSLIVSPTFSRGVTF